MNDLLRDLLTGPRTCHECGAANLKSQTYCSECGVCIRNRNPLVRLLVTILAVAIVGGVVWWKLKW